MKSFAVLVSLSVAVCCVWVSQAQEDLQTSSSDFYQTQWEEYYNQLAEAESVESPTTYNKNSDFLSLVHKNALKDKQDLLGLGGMDTGMVSMGASMLSAVVALGALAYAFTLEARILTNDARSLSTCETLSTITKATLTDVPAVATTDCTIATAGSPTQAEILACINALRTDVNTNLVTAINAYGNPTC